MSLFLNLQRQARSSPASAAQLRALEMTLNHFRVRKNREKFADALLQFRILKDTNVALNCDDPRVAQLMRVEEYFSTLLGKNRAPVLV